MSESPSRSLENASIDPSGDHVGLTSLMASFSVSRVTRRPPVPTVKMSLSPSASLTYAIVLPSGDQAGDDESVFTNLRAPVPFAFIVQTCGKPPRRLVNASREPSGDHEGSVSSQAFEVSRRRPVPSGRTA